MTRAAREDKPGQPKGDGVDRGLSEHDEPRVPRRHLETLEELCVASEEPSLPDGKAVPALAEELVVRHGPQPNPTRLRPQATEIGHKNDDQGREDHQPGDASHAKSSSAQDDRLGFLAESQQTAAARPCHQPAETDEPDDESTSPRQRKDCGEPSGGFLPCLPTRQRRQNAAAESKRHEHEHADNTDDQATGADAPSSSLVARWRGVAPSIPSGCHHQPRQHSAEQHSRDQQVRHRSAPCGDDGRRRSLSMSDGPPRPIEARPPTHSVRLRSMQTRCRMTVPISLRNT